MLAGATNVLWAIAAAEDTIPVLPGLAQAILEGEEAAVGIFFDALPEVQDQLGPDRCRELGLDHELEALNPALDGAFVSA